MHERASCTVKRALGGFFNAAVNFPVYELLFGKLVDRILYKQGFNPLLLLYAHTHTHVHARGRTHTSSHHGRRLHKPFNNCLNNARRPQNQDFVPGLASAVTPPEPEISGIFVFPSLL